MPKLATQPKPDNVTNADILEVMHGYAQQNEQRFQNIEQHLSGHDQQLINIDQRLASHDQHFGKLEKRMDNMTNTLDFIATAVKDIRQEQVAFADTYKKQDQRLEKVEQKTTHHDFQITQLHTHVGLAIS